MKKSLLLAIAICFTGVLGYSQLNMSLLSQIDYPATLNDVWGWESPDGIEYALVGLQNGVSIVSLADPNNAEEVVFIPGQQSTWRDLKTWGNYCYVVTDQGGTTEGLTVIDLSDLPNSAPYFHWTPDLPDLGVMNRCHNLWIDEFGFCYLAGCDVNSGGLLFIDVFSDPGNPQFIAAGAPEYSHDVYVRDNIAYSSEIYQGHLGIYDVSDKFNVDLEATQPTPFAFTHNAWLSDDGSVVFTTDEKANAPVAAYDISDLSDIQELDQYKPVETLGLGVIPHNVHVWDDWLIISYYTDGGKIVDAAEPDNLIEVGNFDTFFTSDGGFSGAWGAYPYLESGIVLVSDMQNGLYVLDANYVRACYLEGNVTSTYDGSNLSDVQVIIDGPEANFESTDLFGDYKTGQATPGTFPVTFTKPGYIPKTVDANFENGVLTVLNVELTPEAIVTGLVISDEDNSPIPNAEVELFGNGFSVKATTSGDGTFSTAISAGEYDAYAAAWGYKYGVEFGLTFPTSETLTFVLKKGYEDNFMLDLGWETTSTATTGHWERVVPEQSTYDGQISTPGEDDANDLGNMCFVTGNGGNGGDNDVDDGIVTITSPIMDLSEYNEPIMRYVAFFFNDGGFGTPNDALEIRLSNGIDEITLTTLDNSLTGWSDVFEFSLAGMIDLTENMQLTVETYDLGAGHISESAFDAFEVFDANPPPPPTSVEEIQIVKAWSAFPNPFADNSILDYDLNQDQASLVVRNALGQLIEQRPLPGLSGQVTFGEEYEAGIYFLELQLDGTTLISEKVIKVQ